MTLRSQDDLLMVHGDNDSLWTVRQFLGLMAFVGVCSGFPHILLKSFGFFITGDHLYM